MSYQVLARKWRPRNFQEMVGQEHVLRMLTNALNHQRIHHAYLFTGTRGVGKTTLARILAKCLNCETGTTGTPCGHCPICIAIDGGRFLDLIEIDAASRTKVEDTREILDNVQYAPSQGRFKIYLIDEVHMLSGHSFNALLKTLEEPPAHVKFLLATTDPKRLPITILSRCLQFNLKRVPVDQIEQHLQHICTQEKITYEEPALRLLAHAADGSMRDALSLLDQTIAFCQQHISTQETREMLGSIEQDAIDRLLETLIAADGKKLLTELTQLSQYAPDCGQILEELLNRLHEISLTQVVPNLPVESNTLIEFAKQLSPETVQLYYQIVLNGRRDLPLAPTPHQGLEMVFLRLLAFRPHSDSANSGLKNAVMKTQNSTDTARVAPKNTVSSQVATAPAIQPDSQPSQVPPEPSENKNWTELLPKLKLTGLAQALAANCSLLAMSASNVILALAKKHEAMLNKKLHERIEQTLSTYFQKPLKLEFKITGDELETPAKVEQAVKEIQQINATDAIKNDTHVQKLMDMFGGTLDLGSVKAVES